jgi:dihydrofolate reductase
MISIIAAIDSNKGIGKGGKIPWHLPEDLKHFKEITSGHPVIMGRKTYESIGRILQDRTNIVITHDVSKVKTHGPGLPVVAVSLEDAIAAARQSPGAEEIFIIGGGQIYQESLPFVEKLYLTVIDRDFNCDTFFPDFREFEKIIKKEDNSSNNLSYQFIELGRS